MPNAPKLNNAWWRWFGSGPRNPPAIIRLHGSAKVHRLGTIAGQRSRESAMDYGAMGSDRPTLSGAAKPNPHQRPSWSRLRARGFGPASPGALYGHSLRAMLAAQMVFQSA
jgi:hypothetical protein